MSNTVNRSLSSIEEGGGNDDFSTSGRSSSVSFVCDTSDTFPDDTYVLETEPLYKNNNTESTNNINNSSNNIRDIMEFSKLKLLQRMHNELMNLTERKLLYFSMLFTMIGGILRLIFFSFIGSIIDLLGNEYDYNDPIGHHIICSFHEFIDCSTNQSLITVFIGTLFILSIILSLSKLCESLLITVCCNSFIKRLNYLVFDVIIGSDLSFFDCREIRDLRYLLTSDLKHIIKTLYSTQNMIESFIYFICCIIYLFIYNWDVALIVICSFLLLIIISKVYNKKAIKIYENMANSFKVAIITLSEHLNYIETIKIFDKEDDEEFVFQQCINRAFKFEKMKNVLLYCYRFWITIITYFTILFVVWYGTISSHISIGQLMINLFVLLQLNYCIYHIIKSSNKIYPKSVARIINILDENEKKKEEKKEEIIIFEEEKEELILEEEKEETNYYNDDEYDVKGLIEMKDIEFSYPSSHKKLILNNISLSFNSSSITALVGMSGSSKLSILELIMKLYLPQKGEIFINNININNYDYNSNNIGYIGKNIHLFENRTIADNIKFGIKLNGRNYQNQLKQIDIENAAKIANCHQFIIKLENGYNTIIGGINGIKLNEGEKQRIGIARSILLKPKILLIDETMSHFDSISKYLINESLDNIIYGKCVIVIAQRLKTIKRANKIYVIHNGKIVQSGNHNELIQITDGQYFKLNQREIFN